MRIKIKFTKNTEPVPMGNYSLLNSYINNCLGRNNMFHDKTGAYTISNLQGGFMNNDGSSTLNFENGGYFIVSAFQSDLVLIDSLLKGIIDNPVFGFGMRYKEIEFITERFHDGHNDFLTLSPILLKENLGIKKYRYVTFEDNDFLPMLIERTKAKLEKIKPGIDLIVLDITIPVCKSRKVKRILVRNVLI